MNSTALMKADFRRWRTRSPSYAQRSGA